MPFISKGGGGDSAKGTATTDQVKASVEAVGSKVDTLNAEIKAVQAQIATPGAPPATTCALIAGLILGMTTTDPDQA